MSISTVVIEDHLLESIEWGLSFTDNNPEPEHYFKMPDKETAFRLSEYLSAFPVKEEQFIYTDPEVSYSNPSICEAD